MAYSGRYSGGGMSGGMGNMNKMMKQVQKMQADMALLQEKMSEIYIEVTAGGGAVRLTMNCKQEISELQLDPDILSPDDVEIIQDLLITAINEGVKKTQERYEEEMAKITGGINVPGIF